jgi:CRP-like cAMP-binding protein
VARPGALGSSTLLRGLTPAQIDTVAALARERRYAAGEHLLREGESDAFVYVLLEGRAALVKTPSDGAAPARIGELSIGDTFGEVKIVDRQPSSASVVALTPVTALAVDLDVFDGQDGLEEARATVWRNVGQILAERLRRTSVTGAEAIQRELAESRARVYAGRFFLFVFCTIAGIQFAFSALGLVPPGRRPPVFVVSFVGIAATAIAVWLSLRRSPFPRESYGLTLRGGGACARQALAWTAPALLLLLLLKWAGIHWVPALAGRPLLDPWAVFAGGAVHWPLYAVSALLYGVHAPLQEFVGRAVFQGSLQQFLRVPPGRVDWKVVWMSTLLFASSHVILGFWFAAATIPPGLFWGWMFARQRSVVGVSVSHIAMGWWAFFAVGGQAVIPRV